MIWRMLLLFACMMLFKDCADDAWQERRVASFILDTMLMMATVALMVLMAFFQSYK